MPVPPQLNELTYRIIACAIAVHRALGPGLLESAYRACLIAELRHAGFHEAQLVTYLKLANKPLGLLLNFNVPIMKSGIVRKINTD
jgi:hypothetical protein